MDIYDYTKYLLLEDQKINEFENKGIVKLYDANKNFGDLIIKNLDPNCIFEIQISGQYIPYYIDFGNMSVMGTMPYIYTYKYKDILNSKNFTINLTELCKFIFKNKYLENLNILDIDIKYLDDLMFFKMYDKTLNYLLKMILKIRNPRLSIFDPYTYNPFIKDHIKFISKI